MALFDAGQRLRDVDERELLIASPTTRPWPSTGPRRWATARSWRCISDRERIARDLHDVVIQRLFAIGLQLQARAR